MIPETQRQPQPQDLDAEHALLGAILSYPEVLEEVAPILRPQHFYRELNGIIYSACVELFLHQEPIDTVTVGAALEKSQLLERIGGRTQLAVLTTGGYVKQNAIYYARILIELFQKRQIIEVARDTVNKGMSNGISTDDFLDETLQKFFALTSTTGRLAEKLGDSAISEYITILSTPQPPRLAWPWKGLDKILHGLRPGEMTVIGGRPGAGKSAFAMNLALHVAMESKKPIGIFSLEMSKRDLVNRLLAQLAKVDSSLLKDSEVTPEEWTRVLEAAIPLSDAPIYVDDDSGLTEIDLITKTRKMKYQHNIEVIVLDYLQLLKGTGRSGNREQEVSGFAQTAKRVARELDIAVIVLSSLNRGPEFREDHRPMLSDFRESGSIESEADVVLGLYRDYYYNPQGNPLDAEVIVLKQRNGPTGSIHLKFEKKYTMFWSDE